MSFGGASQHAHTHSDAAEEDSDSMMPMYFHASGGYPLLFKVRTVEQYGILFDHSRVGTSHSVASHSALRGAETDSAQQARRRAVPRLALLTVSSKTALL